MANCEECIAMRQALRVIEKRVESIEGAFPNNDYAGHCRGHLAMMEDIESRKRLTQTIREKTIGGLIWAGLVGLGMLLWAGIKSRLAGMF
jgi:hypothetical protein